MMFDKNDELYDINNEYNQIEKFKGPRIKGVRGKGGTPEEN